MKNEDRCVCCGNIIPEGTMVCSECVNTNKSKNSMGIQEAICRIKDHMEIHGIGQYPHIKLAEALNMAINALIMVEKNEL